MGEICPPSRGIILTRFSVLRGDSEMILISDCFRLASAVCRGFCTGRGRAFAERKTTVEKWSDQSEVVCVKILGGPGGPAVRCWQAESFLVRQLSRELGGPGEEPGGPATPREQINDRVKPLYWVASSGVDVRSGNCLREARVTE